MEKIKEFVSRFTPYLEDIRKKVYYTSIIFCIFFILGFAFTKKIIEYIINFFDMENVIIATTSPFQFADLSINIGLLCACLFSFPVLIYNIFSFLKPALSKNERRLFFSFIPISIILFIFGVSYGVLIMYYALVLLAKINEKIGIQNIWDIGMFLTQIISTSVLLGILFQFPLFITYTIKANLMEVEILKRKRRIAVFIIFVFATLLPPTDGLSLLAMVLPLIMLYEVTILINSRISKAGVIIN